MARVNINKLNFEEVGEFVRFNKTKKRTNQDEIPTNKKKLKR